MVKTAITANVTRYAVKVQEIQGEEVLEIKDDEYLKTAVVNDDGPAVSEEEQHVEGTHVVTITKDGPAARKVVVAIQMKTALVQPKQMTNGTCLEMGKASMKPVLGCDQSYLDVPTITQALTITSLRLLLVIQDARKQGGACLTREKTLEETNDLCEDLRVQGQRSLQLFLNLFQAPVSHHFAAKHSFLRTTVGTAWKMKALMLEER